MTACTDDERRRVAERLREYASWDDEEDCLVDCAEWGESVLNLLNCGDTEGECYAALADLIEPEPERTCRVKSSHEEEGDGCYAYFEYELTCGHEIAWGDQLPPSYCPECGRRVLYDSDKYL